MACDRIILRITGDLPHNRRIAHNELRAEFVLSAIKVSRGRRVWYRTIAICNRIRERFITEHNNLHFTRNNRSRTFRRHGFNATILALRVSALDLLGDRTFRRRSLRRRPNYGDKCGGNATQRYTTERLSRSL